ncbi:hypothetical protein HAX54_040646, partial [Datura stramonium]|nr:hypothetical protein [Datura stramonium]
MGQDSEPLREELPNNTKMEDHGENNWDIAESSDSKEIMKCLNTLISRLDRNEKKFNARIKCEQYRSLEAVQILLQYRSDRTGSDYQTHQRHKVAKIHL